MAWVEEWRWQDGTSVVDNLQVAAMHPNGSSCVLAGRTSGNWSTTNTGAYDFMAVNLDMDGNILWEWQDGTDGDDHVYAGGVASDGSVVLAGYTTGAYDAENAGLRDFVVIKLDGDGLFLWAWQDGTSFSDRWERLVIDVDGSVVLAGETGGNWDATSDGDSDWAAMKLDAEGTVVWKWQDDGGDGLGSLGEIALSENGSVVLAGVNDGDFAAVKLDANGNKTWVRQGTGEDEEFWTMAAAGNGYFVLAGNTYGNRSGTNAGDSDFVAVKLDASGSEVWRWQDGSNSNDAMFGAIALNEGSVILVGRTEGDFVGTNQGSSDFVAVELDTNGTVLWRWQDGTDGLDSLKAVAADNTGRFIMAGEARGGWKGSHIGGRDFAAVLIDTQSTLPPTRSPTPFSPSATLPLTTSPSPSGSSGLPATPSPTPFSSSTAFPLTTSPSPTGSAGLPVTHAPILSPNLGPAGRSFSTAAIAVVVAVVAPVAVLLTVCLWRKIRRLKDEGRHLAREMLPSQMSRSPVVDVSKSVILPTDNSYGPNIVIAAPPALHENALELEMSASSSRREDLIKVIKVDGQDCVESEGGAMLTNSTTATSMALPALSSRPLLCSPSIVTFPETTISESAATNVAESRNSTGSAFPGKVGISAAVAVMEAASAVASSSSIPGVSEAARLVSVLVKLVVDKLDNDIAGDWRVRWCRSIVAVLELASELIEKSDEIGRNAERYLLEDVYDSVSDLVGIMQTYNTKNKISRLFMSTLFKRRQEEAEAVINRAISRLQLGLQVQAGHDFVSVGRDVREGIEHMKAERKTQEKSQEGLVTDAVKHEMAESRRARRQRRLQQLEIPEDQLTLTDVLLGKGGFGEVYLADYSGVNAAAKVLQIDNDYSQESDLYDFDSVPDGEDRARKLELQTNQRKIFFRELQAMTRLKSPHTVQVFGAMTSRKDRFVLVMELMPGGDLRTLLRQTGKRLPEVRERRIMKYICSGMAFLHNRGVIHGDLKSANVLFDSAGTAKIADFGTARLTQHVASTDLTTAISTTKSNINHMSIAWAAPEVLDYECVSFESDVYSFGIVAWEILARQIPWANLNPRTIIRRVLVGERPSIPGETAADLAGVIRSCWLDNPRARPKFAEILDRMKLWST